MRTLEEKMALQRKP